MRKFFKDFKAFISRGNIVDLAVAVIIGGAFSAIVTAFTNKIIMPCINWILSLGGDGLTSAYTFLKPVYSTDAAGEFLLNEAGEKIIDLEKSIYIDWGAFITAVINFLIIALTIFIMLKIIMRSSELLKDARAKAGEGKLTYEEKQELKEHGVNKKDKEAVKAYFTQKAEEEARVKAEEEAKAKLEEEEKMKNSTEYLLKEIRDLLQEQKKK